MGPVGTPLSRGPPDRARRADFSHRAPTLGLRASKALLGPGVGNAGLEKWKAPLEILFVPDRKPRTLAPPLKLAIPSVLGVGPERP